MIHLERVTRENAEELLALEVRPDQRSYVADNLESLADAYLALAAGEQVFPFGVYADRTPVGFLMIGYDIREGAAPAIAEDSFCIWRLMIDRRCQHRGYGRQALEQALEWVRRSPCGNAKRCWLSYEPENRTAAALYGSLGFRETGEIADGEAVAVLEL